MPRDGAIIFSDLIGKLDVLRVSCDKCGRDGSYRLNGLIEKRGRDAKVIDWLDEITADCPKKSAYLERGYPCVPHETVGSRNLLPSLVSIASAVSSRNKSA
jgi:hypothetical protein